MDQIANRRIQATAAGEEIVFRPSLSFRLGHTITNLVLLVIAGAGAFWTLPAVRVFFESGELIGPAKHLKRFDLSAEWLFAIVLVWCVILIWWGLGAVYEI